MAQQTTPEDLQSQILERIKKDQGYGYRGVGAIGKANTELKDLESKAKSGAISQDDYIKIASSIKDYITPIAQGANSGKEGSAALAAVGWMDDVQKSFRNIDIYKNAKELLGRDITEKEFAQIAPRFGVPGSTKDLETGRAYLAELAGQEAKSPETLAKKAPQYSGQVNEQFKTLLGRDATANESDYYGRLLATGELSPYEIEQYVKSGQEYQGTADKKFREELSGELGGYRKEAWGDATEQILSRFAKTTGPHRSSGLDDAVARAAGDLQGQTEQYLTGISASQYGGNKANARSDYQTMLNEYLSGQKYNTQRSDAYTDYLTSRADQSVDYTTQMNDYLKFLGQQPKQKSNKLQGAFAGGAAGAGAGPWGVGIGAGLGYLLS